ncbi:MAG: DUF488 domain-containing protein [Chloroflexota bacterium]|jgi:uncharacterized protein (DUF488 family)|nr:DUF488 domain-containing protein [Chloroflexota bacterium]
MATGTLYTFGYARLHGGGDLRELLGQRVEVVVDVRLRPYSRNRAFSLGTRDTVETAPYAYRWLGGLGNAEYRTGGMRLARPEEIEVLIQLLASGTNVALMCACADVTSCHRRLIADLAGERLPGLTVIDL